MLDQNIKGKLKYESPIIVPLGEMARGSGLCATGSSVAPGANCATGGADAGCSVGSSNVPACSAGGAVDAAPINCTAGSNATDACTAGNSANVACTAGPANNGATCSAGGSASPTCTGGAAPG